MRIILASQSPRRSALLRAAGLKFVVIPSDVDESTIPHHSPGELALKSASYKTFEVAERCPNALVIGADTVVCLGNTIFGKPHESSEATRMLGELSGQTHAVITGIAVKDRSVNSMVLDSVETKVTMKALSEVEIADYVANGEPLDKAGAYAIQGRGRRLIRKIEGCYFNVVGLPLTRLYEILKEFLPDLELRLPSSPWPSPEE